MKGLYLVEPLVAFYSFASFLVYPLIQQYVYRRLWQELTNTTYPVSDNTSRCDPSNTSSHHEEVQKAASLFSLYTELFSMIPSLAVTLVLVAYSDQRGRKITIILPLIGSLFYALSFLAVSFFELDLYLLIVSAFVSALFGGSGTFLGGCFSYIADLCEDGQQKTLRMAGVDMVIGLLSGVASLSTGYFLQAAGFNWPFFTSALFQCFNLIYAVFILEETLQRPPDDPLDGSPRRTAMRQLACGVYQLFAGASRRRNILLVLLLLLFSSFSFANMGGLSMITLYELNQPLCWTEILIGYGSALSTTVFLTSFVGVTVFSRCGVPDLVIILMGILSVMAGMTLVAFVKTTLMMFLVRLPMLLAIMPFPVLRSMMSKIVSKNEQGALFACLACLDSVSISVAIAVFNSLYAVTVTWYPGFCFLLSAGLCVIPLAMLAGVGLLGVEEGKEAKETEALIPGEEGLAGDENDNPPLT
ncbi:solute carrier family 46 member 3 isoform X1 [Salmo salar]|uniref:Solute carrier family 46 member 3 isoform X1 n=2 Tax=Salmo salar TaxID=8030 RepID=A0A1S3L2U5_SALSA|nr:solute carrier family 46 member 3 isoform X1 [Salmo salar]XP_045546200.1 solute carrier family 46 member 3 isoform X1 [Salmo salar]|eukprot:XP_013985282.1 PREDICTED: solute carrier family 46 member 3-like isoform X1 [Salmo salar]